MIKSILLGPQLPFLESERKRSKDKPTLTRSANLVNRVFEFQPGLNLLVGENGSGKSSLLETMANRLLCFNYGFPKIDKEVYSMFSDLWQKDEEYYWRPSTFMPDVEIRAEQTPYTMYASPDFTPRGMPDRGHALCYGLGEAAIKFFEMTDTHSSGQGMSNIIQAQFEAVRTGIRPVDRKAVADYAFRSDSDSQKQNIATLNELLPEPNAPVLLLLDEPERALDLRAQLQFWQDLIELCKRPDVQVIIATHSVIPLFLRDSGANYIEMTEGYADQIAYNAQAICA